MEGIERDANGRILLSCPICGGYLSQDAKTADITCTGGCVFMGGFQELIGAQIRRSEKLIWAGVQILRESHALLADLLKGGVIQNEAAAKQALGHMDRYIAHFDDIAKHGIDEVMKKARKS